MIPSLRSALTYCVDEIASLQEDRSVTCLDAFIEKYSEYTPILQESKFLRLCLEEGELLEESPESLLVLSAFAGKPESYVYREHQIKEMPLLHFAALGGQKTLIEWLVTNGGWDLQKTDASGRSVLEYAFLGKQKELISWLETQPGFGMATVISRLFFINWREPERLNGEVGAKIVQLITTVLSVSGLSEISEDLENLFENSFEALSYTIDEIGQLECLIQNKEEVTKFEKVFSIILRVMVVIRSKNPEIKPASLVGMMINLVRVRYAGTNVLLGTGAYSKVYRIYNVINARHYAVKAVRRLMTEQDRLDLQNEKDILDYINQNTPVYSLAIKVDYILYKNKMSLVFELYGSNIFDGLINRISHGVSLLFAKKIGEQLVEALLYLDRLGIIHADLKPQNILLKQGSQDRIVLSDFGNSIRLPFTEENRERLSGEMSCQTLWYRSPECALATIVEGLDYGCGIDVWSLGCVLIELFQKKALFPLNTKRELHAWHQVRLGSYPESLYFRRGTKLESLYVQNPRYSIPNMIRNSIQEKQRYQGAVSECPRKVDEFIDLTQVQFFRDF